MSPNWVTLLSCRSKGGILPYPRFPALTFVGWSGQWYGRPILTKVVKWQNLGERAAFVMREWIEPCPTPFPCRDLRWAPAHAQWPQDKRVIKYARHLAAEFFFCKLDKVSWVATEKRNEPRGSPLWTPSSLERKDDEFPWVNMRGPKPEYSLMYRIAVSRKWQEGLYEYIWPSDRIKGVLHVCLQNCPFFVGFQQ